MLFKDKCRELGEYGQQLLKEYDYEENEKHNIDIDNLTGGSSKDIYWICSKCGEKFIRSINRRMHSKQCPNCWKTRVVKGKNDLYTWCLNNGEFGKKLMEEFNEAENNISIHNISYGSQKKIKWRCKNNHKWTANVITRTAHKSGCPYCSAGSISLSEKFIYNALSSVIPNMEENYRLPTKLGGYELDICIPDLKVAIEYDGYFWHEKPYNGEYAEGSIEQYKTDICKQFGVRLIHIYDGGDTYEPTIFNNIINFKIDKKLKYEQLKLVIQLLLKEFNVEDTINYELIKEYTIKTYNIIKYEDTLAYQCPELLEEWDYEENKLYTPETISAKSQNKVHWVCKKCKQKWEATVLHRSTYKRGCPVCSNHKVIEGINDLQTLFPNIAKEWHPTLNKKKPTEVPAGNCDRIYWICSKCGYGENGEWQVMTYHRTHNKSGCPVCANVKVMTKFNDLQTVYPELAKEYHSTLNSKPVTEISATWHRKVYWQCTKCGYGQNGEWQAAPGRRQSKGYETGCPKCKYKWFKHTD